MDWISLKEKLPESSGNYLVSINKPNDSSTFKYVAYFDAASRNWHKYDPFSEKEEIGENISFKVKGWFEGINALID